MVCKMKIDLLKEEFALLQDILTKKRLSTLKMILKAMQVGWDLADLPCSGIQSSKQDSVLTLFIIIKWIFKTHKQPKFKKLLKKLLKVPTKKKKKIKTNVASYFYSISLLVKYKIYGFKF